MSRRNIGDIVRPPRQFRLGVKGCPRSSNIRFETIADSRMEDRRRARGLRRAIRSYPDAIHVEDAERLARRLETCAEGQDPPDSLASSVQMRQYRIGVVGALWELCGKGHHVTTATIIPKSWEFIPDELPGVEPARLLSAVRSDLYRKGAAGSRGWLFGYIHGEFDPVGGVFRLHLHIVCRRAMVPVIDGLRGIANYRSTRFLPSGELSPVFRRVWIRRKRLINMPNPITYVMQAFWPSRPILIDKGGKRTRVRQKRAIPEPYHSQVLLWLDRWSLQDLTLMVGLRVTRRGLKKTARGP